jgi:hypothetical protein
MIETVTTQVHLDVNRETAWNLIMFYEEVPGRPPFPLRVFMPDPVRTEGKKTGVEARVRCIYKRGYLVKRITALDPPCLIQFEVTEHRLGIEGCATALEGSYAIRPSKDGADIVLTTRYAAYLRPRYLWKPLEKLVAGQLHRHVLAGMRSSLPTMPGHAYAPSEPFASPSVEKEDSHAHLPH